MNNRELLSRYQTDLTALNQEAYQPFGKQYSNWQKQKQ